MPVMIVLQEANIVVDGQEKEHKERVVAQKKKMSKNVGKQILFLDDYEEEVEEDEDDHQPTQTTATTIIPQATSSPKIELEKPTENVNVNRMRELEEAKERLRQQLFQQNIEDDDLNEEDDDEDDDLFFFKPGFLFNILNHY